MTESEIVDACKPEVCDAGLVVVSAMIINDPKASYQSAHIEQMQ